MEVDLTSVTEEEIQYWCDEFPYLDRQEVIEVLSVIDISSVKEDFWRDNPTLEETDVNRAAAHAAVASYEHHLYNDLNNEAP